ncbi:purple acid phosphatase-like [Telopea speciosissima]|uniref:purple acid phosphatase-like n=1 Tax=Telopea speciosissima TaxID=54955 RepID=UPI001CC5E4EA|nr:purple acid phosphatase-like [Telopea speciosissima]
MAKMGNWGTHAIVLVGFFLSSALLCSGGVTSSFVKVNYPSVDMPLNSDVFSVPPGYNAPQQVHITQGDLVGQSMIVSWVTADEPGSSTVLYWAENSTMKYSAEGFYLTYKYYNYSSGFIHHCTINNLEYNTTYYYEVGVGNTARQFSFITPPPVGLDVPYTFGLIADLGQTLNSNTTLTHYQMNPLKGQTVLYVGDFSYADNYPFHDNTRWDTWGRFIERSAAYQPWITSQYWD